jgi:hypothetical protein
MQKSTTEAVTDEIVYRIDAGGRLAYVSGAWNAFAAANGAPHLVSALVLGRPLRDFISDPETRYIVEALVRRATATGEIIQVSVRCDAPHERRRLEMRVVPLGEGVVEFRTRPQALEGRETVPMLDRGAPRTAELLKMCSWCNRVRVDDGWHEVEVAVDRLGLFEAAALPALTHGICRECWDQVMEL